MPSQPSRPHTARSFSGSGRWMVALGRRDHNAVVPMLPPLAPILLFSDSFRDPMSLNNKSTSFHLCTRPFISYLSPPRRHRLHMLLLIELLSGLSHNPERGKECRNRSSDKPCKGRYDGQWQKKSNSLHVYDGRCGSPLLAP
jgi:hypothetical protein